MYLFGDGLIKCVDCRKNYRGKKERDKKVYICSGYSNKQTECKRYRLMEEELVYLISKHIEIKGKRAIDEKDLVSYIKKIDVSGENKSFTIYYKDNSETLITPNKLIF